MTTDSRIAALTQNIGRSGIAKDIARLEKTFSLLQKAYQAVSEADHVLGGVKNLTEIEETTEGRDVNVSVRVSNIQDDLKTLLIQVESMSEVSPSDIPELY